MLLSDYYLYFLVTSVHTSHAEPDGWCSVHEVFSSFIHRDFTYRKSSAFFDFDFGPSIPSIGLQLVNSGDTDLIGTVFKFVLSIQEMTDAKIYSKHGMDNVWTAFGIRLEYSITIADSGLITFVGNNS